MHILLASQSPRRREMVLWLGLSEILTRAVHVNETPQPGETPAEMAARLALSKAKAVPPGEEVLVLAADTIVDHEGQPLGKPRNAMEAQVMLRRLRRGPHQVHTGITLYDPRTGKYGLRRVTTGVWMRPYSDNEIASYVAGGDPLDKAGAYAIQHPEFHPVARLERCYANVVGLPLCAVASLLAAWGQPLTVNLPAACRAHFGYLCPAVDEGEIL